MMKVELGDDGGGAWWLVEVAKYLPSPMELWTESWGWVDREIACQHQISLAVGLNQSGN
jgi:hypothetical protein